MVRLDLATLALGLALTACGGGHNSPATPTPAPRARSMNAAMIRRASSSVWERWR